MDATNEQIEYWKRSSERDLDVAKDLCKMKHYDACLFYCHLSVEKMIKGLVAVETRKTPPKIHELSVLAKKANLDLSDTMRKNLKIITTFNTAGRYPSVKFNLYKIATKEFAEKMIKTSENIIIWLKKKYL